MKNPFSYILLVLGLAILIGLGVFIHEQNETQKLLVDASADSSLVESAKEVPRLAIIPYDERFPQAGNEDAPVKMIAFLDYECPFSLAFINEQMPRLHEDFIKPGILKLYLYDLPLKQHSDAIELSRSAHIYSEQSQFGSFIEFLQEEHSVLRLQFDSTQISSIDESISYSKEIAGIAGIVATPTFVVNNRVLNGLRSYEDLSSLIQYSETSVIEDMPSENSCK